MCTVTFPAIVRPRSARGLEGCCGLGAELQQRTEARGAEALVTDNTDPTAAGRQARAIRGLGSMAGDGDEAACEGAK